MTTPHLVALDIDGTTVNHEGELSDAVRETVRAVADAGHHVTIATGRAIIGTLPVLDLLGLTTGYRRVRQRRRHHPPRPGPRRPATRSSRR